MENAQLEFRKKLLDSAKKTESRLILAADDISWRNVERVVRDCRRELAAIKVHPEMPANWGLTHQEAIKRLKKMSEGALLILDAKLADIDNSNAMKAKYYFEKGYDAIIVHGFPGRPAVQAVVDVANEQRRGVLLLVAMSSKGHLFTEKKVSRLVEMAHDVGVAGVIAPANQYDLTSTIRSKAKDMLILSPGIGAQGGDPTLAIHAGTDFAIVGRSIMNSEKPGETAKEIKEKLNKAFETKPPKRRGRGVEGLNHKLLEVLVEKGALKFGDFTLKSGRKSTYFFNSGNMDSGKSLTLVGEAFADVIFQNKLHEKFDVILGPAYKGIPLAAATVQQLYDKYGVEKRFVFDRKEVKDHGDKGAFIGGLNSGDRILMVDDVITTGGAKLDVMKKLEGLGVEAKVTELLILFNRQEKDLEGNDPVKEMEKKGVNVTSVLNAKEVFSYLRGKTIGGKPALTDEMYKSFKDHQKEYGVKC